jgi:hypothetical protein
VFALIVLLEIGGKTYPMGDGQISEAGRPVAFHLLESFLPHSNICRRFFHPIRSTLLLGRPLDEKGRCREKIFCTRKIAAGSSFPLKICAEKELEITGEERHFREN